MRNVELQQLLQTIKPTLVEEVKEEIKAYEDRRLLFAPQSRRRDFDSIYCALNRNGSMNNFLAGCFDFNLSIRGLRYWKDVNEQYQKLHKEQYEKDEVISCMN